MSAYAACLQEVEAFVDQFAENETVTVSRGDDVVAALVGLLHYGTVTGRMLQGLYLAGVAAQEFTSE
ncbi:hypothetical protein [Nocardioides massiliensis]|uniref:Uncharacterized protein n=1 Tax=Nocardioides massiliensis TaxID=1325935 RepID=A0ABT9NJC3_9ACTN|nr:hypothetical protein [Nocardioides massiliensis]MDP9820523.1 hypothetical protein [Nocardioides massiliensis]